MGRFPLGRELLAKVPGALEASLLFRHYVLPQAPENFSWRALPDWLNDARRLKSTKLDRPELRVLVFGPRETISRLGVAISVILLTRRCRVDFAFTPYNILDREDPPAEVKTIRFHYRRSLRNHPDCGLRFLDVTEMPAAPTSERMLEEAKKQSLIDVCYLLYREEFDIEGCPEHRRLFEFRMRRNIDCLQRLTGHLQQNRYDAILTANGNLVETGCLFRAGQELQIPVTSFEFNERQESIVFSTQSPAVHTDTSQEWLEDEPHVMTPEIRARIEELMRERSGTRWQGFFYQYQKAERQGVSQVLSRLGIAKDGKPISLLCPNIAWDSAWLGLNNVFESMMDWLRQTVRHYANNPNSHLIVRAHPAEYPDGTNEPVLDAIRASLPDLPDNIHLIAPTDSYNTYDLIEACDFGIVYNSTTGMEMAMRGVPALVAGAPHYGGKGFTLDAQSVEDYFSKLDRLVSDPAGHRLSERQVELAWCYADLYFFRWPKPFPWTLAGFWNDLKRWPISRVLSPEGEAKFGATFDLLVGRAASSRS